MDVQKVCSKCGETKPVSEFYKQRGMSDGYLSHCKECVKARVKARYYANPEKIKEYELSRNKSAKRREQRAKYQREGRKKDPLRYLAYQNKDKIKYIAHYLSGNAIRDGRLVRGPCEVCGAKKTEAHHEDYYKPLEVRWLCRKHHLEAHGLTHYNTNGKTAKEVKELLSC